MIKELNKFLSECRFTLNSVSVKLLSDNTLDYYLDRAVEAIRSVRTHQGDANSAVANLKTAVKMCAFAYFRFAYGEIQTAAFRKKRT